MINDRDNYVRVALLFMKHVKLVQKVELGP